MHCRCLVFINDLPSFAQVAKLLLYADDTKCYCFSSPIQSLAICDLQADLNNLFHWSVSNISFNSAKSTYLCFTNSKTPTAVDLFLDGQTISKSHSHKDLGVIISDDLTWSSHYTCLVSKALKTLGLVKRSVSSSATAQVHKTPSNFQLEFPICEISTKNAIFTIILQKIIEKVKKYIKNVEKA